MSTATVPNRLDHAQQTVQVIRQFWNREAATAIILGTGLGGFEQAMETECILNYEDLPHFPCSTAIGHEGRMVCGLLHDVPVIAMQGRCHLYEGASLKSIQYAVEVLHALHVETLIVSCAAGGLSSDLVAGDLMLINDHLDFLFARDQKRFNSSPDRGQHYDSQLNRTLLKLARQCNISLKAGTYMAVQGPNYETRAELRFFKRLADAIGMSTIPEVIRARQLGMRVCGIATITNVCNPDLQIEADGHEVINVATQAEPKFRKLVSELIRWESLRFRGES